MLRPDSVSSRRKYSVRIHGVLDCFVKMQQRVVVVGILLHDRVVESWRRAVFPPTVLTCDLDHALDDRAILLVRLNVMSDRKSENIDEGPFPITRGETKAEV